MTSSTVAYCLWFFLGVFGVHHFYLGRDLHGIVMFCTLGGFLIGWFHDFFALGRYIDDARDIFDSPEYQASLDEYYEKKKLMDGKKMALKQQSADNAQVLQEANGDALQLNEIKNRLNKLERLLSKSAHFNAMKLRKTPYCGWSRYFGEVLAGLICALIWLSAFPSEWFDDDKRKVIDYTWNVPIAFGDARMVIEFATPILVSIGIYVVGNIGRHEVRFRTVLVCSYASFIVYAADFNNIFYGSFLTTSIANWMCRKWRKKSVKRSKLRRCAQVSVFCSIFCCLLVFGLLNNAKVTTEDGESVPLKVAIKNFFKSPLWTEMSRTAWQLYEFWQIHGTARLWREFLEALDPSGQSNAYKVLGLVESATQEDINRQCKKLRRELHPDRHTDPEKKAEFHAKFVAVQEACGILSAAMKQKSARNKRTS